MCIITVESQGATIILGLSGILFVWIRGMLENRDVVGQDMTAQLANIVGKNERNGSKS